MRTLLDPNLSSAKLVTTHNLLDQVLPLSNDKEPS
jgi:hypothetical protein